MSQFDQSAHPNPGPPQDPQPEAAEPQQPAPDLSSADIHPSHTIAEPDTSKLLASDREGGARWETQRFLLEQALQRGNEPFALAACQSYICESRDQLYKQNFSAREFHQMAQALAAAYEWLAVKREQRGELVLAKDLWSEGSLLAHREPNISPILRASLSAGDALFALQHGNSDPHQDFSKLVEQMAEAIRLVKSFEQSTTENEAGWDIIQQAQHTRAQIVLRYTRILNEKGEFELALLFVAETLSDLRASIHPDGVLIAKLQAEKAKQLIALKRWDDAFEASSHAVPRLSGTLVGAVSLWLALDVEKARALFGRREYSEALRLIECELMYSAYQLNLSISSFPAAEEEKTFESQLKTHKSALKTIPYEILERWQELTGLAADCSNSLGDISRAKAHRTFQLLLLSEHPEHSKALMLDVYLKLMGVTILERAERLARGSVGLHDGTTELRALSRQIAALAELVIEENADVGLDGLLRLSHDCMRSGLRREMLEAHLRRVKITESRFGRLSKQHREALESYIGACTTKEELGIFEWGARQLFARIIEAPDLTDIDKAARIAAISGQLSLRIAESGGTREAFERAEAIAKRVHQLAGKSWSFCAALSTLVHLRQIVPCNSAAEQQHTKQQMEFALLIAENLKLTGVSRENLPFSADLAWGRLLWGYIRCVEEKTGHIPRKHLDDVIAALTRATAFYENACADHLPEYRNLVLDLALVYRQRGHINSSQSDYSKALRLIEHAERICVEDPMRDSLDREKIYLRTLEAKLGILPMVRSNISQIEMDIKIQIQQIKRRIASTREVDFFDLEGTQ